MYPINVKTAAMIEPIFCVVGLYVHMTPGKVYGCSKLKKLCIQKFLGFCKILKMDTIILLNPRTFLFVFVLLCTKRRCAKIEPQSKVETKDGREAP